jgi:hypothetical protein
MAHLAWPHLAYVADSHGRGVATGRAVSEAMFKVRQDFSVAEIEKWLTEWLEVGMICLYIVDGIRYFQILQWDEYQKDILVSVFHNLS